MKIRLFVALLVSTIFAWNVFAAEPIPMKLEFGSTDKGPFNSKLPTVKKGSPVWVKASWKGFNRKDDIKDPYIFVWLMGNDFAGASSGKKDGEVYCARPNPYYLPITATEFVFELGIGERKEGTMGIMNKWDKDAGKFIDGPLPACAALPAGTYEVKVKVYYYKQGEPETGARGETTFTLTVTD